MYWNFHSRPRNRQKNTVFKKLLFTTGISRDRISKYLNISVKFLCNWFLYKTLLEIPSFIQNNLDQKSPKLLAVILEVCRESDVFILRDLYFNVFSTIFSCFKLSAYLILIKKKVVLIIFLSIHLLFPMFSIFVWKFENYHASV